MDMKLVLILVAFAAMIWFAMKHQGNRDGPDQVCADDVIQLLKQNHDANPEQIYEVFVAHQRHHQDIDAVTKLVVAQLFKTRIRKEDQQDILINIRKAKRMLPDAPEQNQG